MQRVRRASVMVDDEVVGEIARGVVVLVGVTAADGDAEARWLADKVAHLRIFGDDEGKMNRSLVDVGGEALVVSQFTLYGDARRGRRPSFVHAAQGDEARAVYEQVVGALRTAGVPTATGRFGATMMVSLINDGPVTILLDSDKTF
ncbi:D-aminoacyl-tRNA deacylase [soil metagenome]